MHRRRRSHPRETQFRRFYRDYVGFVVRTVELLGLSGTHADDVAQEVFIVAHRKLDPLEGPGTRTWLFSTTRHLTLRARRTESRLARRRAALSEVLRVRGPDRTTEAWDARQIVVRLLGQLGEPQRTAFVGTELLGMTAAELGAAVDVSPNTIASRLRSARAWLAQAASDEGRTLTELVAQARQDRQTPARVRSALWLGISGRVASTTTMGAPGIAAIKVAAAAALVMVAPQRKPPSLEAARTAIVADPAVAPASPPRRGARLDGVMAASDAARIETSNETSDFDPGRGVLGTQSVPESTVARARGRRTAPAATKPRRDETPPPRDDPGDAPEAAVDAARDVSREGSRSSTSGLGSPSGGAPRLAPRPADRAASFRPRIGDWAAPPGPAPAPPVLQRPAHDGVPSASAGKRSATARPMIIPTVQVPLASVAAAAQGVRQLVRRRRQR